MSTNSLNIGPKIFGKLFNAKNQKFLIESDFYVVFSSTYQRLNDTFDSSKWTENPTENIETYISYAICSKSDFEHAETGAKNFEIFKFIGIIDNSKRFYVSMPVSGAITVDPEQTEFIELGLNAKYALQPGTMSAVIDSYVEDGCKVYYSDFQLVNAENKKQISNLTIVNDYLYGNVNWFKMLEKNYTNITYTIEVGK
jgi:hypothetical protein